jgi:L-threonine kinase
VRQRELISGAPISDIDRYPVVITGKVGEFLQGVTRDGSPILYSATIISPELTTRALGLPAPSFRVFVENQPDRNAEKTERAIRSLLARRRVEQPWDFEVRIRNPSPFAKGLGTSSADMTAGLVAVARYLSLSVTEEELFSIMCAVERSDFLFLPDALVCANPLSAEFSIQGPAPRLWLVGWDGEPERRIATEAVADLDQRRSRYASEYADLASYCNSGETDALLYAVTRSAEINQELLPKPCFGWAYTVAKQLDAALLVAHSGTFMAFAISRDEGDMDRLAGLQGMLHAKGFDPLVFQTGSLADDASWETARTIEAALSRIDNPALSDPVRPVI